MKPQISSAVIQAASILMVALLMLAYWAALPGPFLLDDFANLPQAKVETWNLSALIEASLSNNSGLLGRPVSAMTFALNYLVMGDSTFGFKVVNLAIHAVNTSLVFLLCRKLMAENRGVHPVTTLASGHVALAVALLWAIHPIHVSTVMYVVQRMSLLSTLFMLAAMYCYVNARTCSTARKRSSLGLICATVLLGLLGIFSKENGVLLMAYVVLIEWIIIRKSENFTNYTRKKLGVLLTLGTTATLSVAYPFFSHFKGIMSGYQFREFTLTERVLTQPVVVFDYVGQTLLPRISQMGLYFDAFPVVENLDTTLIWSMLFLLGITITFFVSLRTKPLLSLCIGIFLVSHSIESTFLPLELKFEHRNYFGSIWIVTGVAVVIGSCRCFHNRPFIAKSLFGILLLILTILTTIRAYDWKDDMTLNVQETERAPLSKRARSALAISLSQAGKTDDALEEVKKTIRHYPDDTYAPLQLFQICALASSDCTEELNTAHKAVKIGLITMDTVSILSDLSANNRMGLIKSFESANLLELLKASNDNPNRRMRNIDEAKLQLLLAEEFLATRKMGEIIDAIKKAVALDSTNTLLLIRAAEITAGVGSLEDAKSVMVHLEKVAPEAALESERFLAVKSHIEKRKNLESGRTELLDN